MAERGPDLEELAGRISDGRAVDWDEAERSASSEEHRKVIRRLRLVESLARVHRDGEQAGDGTSASSPGGPSSRSEAPTVGPGSAESAPALDADEHPETWGNLARLQWIGEGAFGEVYRAWDPNLERDVALKLLRPGRPGGPEVASTVLKEGRLLARVRHPNVVTVHGAETHGDRVGLWMEFVRGLTLSRLLEEQGELSAREASLIGIDLSRALAAVHRAGLIHRDIKAQNVMREDGGRIVLMDFGAGKELRLERGRDQETISGTPLYMAPEIFFGQPATERSDIYGLGVLLYHLVTRSHPLHGRTLGELRALFQRQESRLLRDERPDLPQAFIEVVERATALDPADRFATAGEMERALAAALGADSSADAPIPARETRPGSRRTARALAAALVLTIGAGSYVAWRALRPGPTETSPAPGAAGASATAPLPGSYTVRASLFRLGADGGRGRLESGDRLSLGDELTLEFEASRSVHVYVIDEDEMGNAFALFPLPDLDLRNPLPGGTTHTLPGSRAGKSLSWVVDSPGGTEHLMVLASPERLLEFEAEMNALARPRGAMGVQIPDSAKLRLRSIGVLGERAEPTPGADAQRLFELAQRLAGTSEVVQGPWLRRIDLENPPE
jgi:hypothetical protein